jgi:3-methyladenine DNA glycosylase AlkD
VWDGAASREERHAAVELTGLRACRAFQTPAALPLYEHLVVTGAWWDLVDPVATGRIGGLAADFPDEIVPVLLRWSGDGDIWRRRTAILHQIRYRLATDTHRLTACIEPSLDSREFFLRKAIGWALRSYAWSDPDWVTAYVRAHEDRLSGLSRREALKNVHPGRPLLAAEVTGE